MRSLHWTMSAAAIVVVSGAVAYGQHWPSFRGEAARGVGDGAAPPTRWTSASGVRWRADIPGLSHASPIVWGDRLYVLSARADGASLDLQAKGVVFAKDTVQHEWTLHCFEITSGQRRWTKTIHTGTPRQARHVRGTYANATPATDGRVIALSLGNEGLFGFDMEGQRLWHVPMTPPTPGASLDAASSPVIVGDLAVVQNDWSEGGFAAAYELRTGRERWRVARREGLAWATPGVWSVPGAAAQVVFNSARWVRGHDAATGRELWRVDNSVTQPWDRVPTPVPSGRLLVVAGGGPDGQLFALRHGITGEIPSLTGTPAAVAWRAERGAPYLPTPLIHRGLVYVVADNGVLSVYREETGALVYRNRIAPDIGTISASPVASGDHVYVPSQDGDVFVVRAGETFELVARNPMGDPIFATPALAANALVIRTASAVHVVGR